MNIRAASCVIYRLGVLAIFALPLLAAGQAPPPRVTPQISDFVLYAERSIRIGHHSHTEGGEVGVRTAMPPAKPREGIAQLQLEEHAKCGIAFSPSTSLEDDSETGKLWTDSLKRVKDTEIGPEGAFPAALMPPLPLASASGSGENIHVEERKMLDLTPGVYGALVIEEHGTLRLAAGRYTFTSVKMEEDSKLLGVRGKDEKRDAANGERASSLEVHIVNGLQMEDEAKIAPDWDDARAKDFLIYVAGTDPAKIEHPASAPPYVRLTPTTVVSIGKKAKIHGLLAAPHGTIWMADGSGGKGAFAGFDIKLAEEVEVEFQDGFSASAPGQQGSQQLHGYFSIGPDPSIGPIAGPVEPDTLIPLAIGLPVRDPAGLKTFVKQVSDPASPNFRQYLSQPQFIATYSPSPADYASLQNWATTNGFTISSTYADNLLLSVGGTAAQIQQALHVNLVYRLRKDGSKFVALDRDPSLDLSVPLLHISGLTDYFLPRRSGLQGTGQFNNYRAVDLRQAYLGTSALCSGLTGAGQVIGLLEFSGFNQPDIIGYDNLQNQNPLQVPALNPANVTQPVVQGAPLFAPTPAPTAEATMDIEMAQAMAPAAAIQVFLGSPGITSHEDDLVAAMANASPALTTASSSWETGRSDNAQQSLDEMASRGVSFFEASGDYGDVGDPQDTLDMDSQTLVGGTFLSTNALISPLPTPVYPNPYYAGETTWNLNPGFQKKGLTGGGIMDGNNQNGQCYCWPHGLCCGSGVPLPSYQLGIDMSTNGGSTSWRNYPDVSMAAANLELFYQGNSAPGFWGTSAAAPLWAGFMALVNQNSLANGQGQAGFVNTTLYDIGKTRGLSTDLYASCFHDIHDGGNNGNGFGPGHTTVAGYDLTTGLGSPTCSLVSQLSTLHPTTPNLPLDIIRFVISTGNDDLRKNHCCGCGGTGLTADVLLQDGTSFPLTLKPTGTDDLWDNNTTTPPLDFPIPSTVVLTPTHGIKGITLTIHEQYSEPGCGPDNWDMTALHVSLYNPPFVSAQASCQLNLNGTSTLQDGSTGLTRFSNSPSPSGVGQTATYLVSSGSGCP
ncbi:MAG: protease pro-enzyme activation domain-containing protein [Terracidiphilus sp.]